MKNMEKINLKQRLKQLREFGLSKEDRAILVRIKLGKPEISAFVNGIFTTFGEVF